MSSSIQCSRFSAGADIIKPEKGVKRKKAHSPNPPALTAFHCGHSIPAQESLVGSLVTGTVDAKMDCGYFVSINIKGYAFQGMSCSDSQLQKPQKQSNWLGQLD